MAEVSYALREDASTIFLLEDGGKRYKNYCQTTVFGRNLIRPEFLGQFLYFAPHAGHNGKFRGTVTDLQMSLEDNGCIPARDYVATIESEVEFKVTASVIRQLSREHMPAWGVKPYLDYFSDRNTGVLLFVRVYKVDQSIDPVYIEKGIKGSAQVLRLYDELENEASLRITGMTPVISDNKFQYLKDEILHLLKVENALITVYDNSTAGKQSLKERLEVDKLLQGTHKRWEERHLQWAEDGFDVDDESDYAQLDYDAIYDRVLQLYPGMSPIITYIKGIQPARLGEYDYWLKNIHEKNERVQESTKRLFDMSVRSAVNKALRYHEKSGGDLEDAFQVSCIGILTAIQKHSDSVEGLFPSYASMWMVQTLGREMPEYPQNVRVPVHYKDYTTPILKRAEKKVGDTPWAGSSFDEFYRLLHSDLSCDSANAQRIASIFYPAESIEEMLEDPEEEMLLSDADELMEDRLIDEYGREEYSKQVRQCVDSLTDREREVLYLRYGLGGNSGKSLQEVGDYYGLTRERVRQIEVKAERHLLQLLLRRHLIERDHYKALPKKYKRQYKKHSN